MLSSSSSRTPDGSLDEAVKRELHEETGIEVEVLGVVGVRTRYTEKHGAVLAIFRCALVSGEPKADDYEISAAEFFDTEQIKALRPVFPLSRQSRYSPRLGVGGSVPGSLSRFVAGAAHHRQTWIFGKARIDLRQATEIEGAAMRAPDDARMAAGGTQPDWVMPVRKVEIGAIGHTSKSRLPKSWRLRQSGDQLLHVKQLNLEDERRIGWNHTARTLRAISQFRGTGEPARAPHLHAL